MNPSQPPLPPPARGPSTREIPVVTPAGATASTATATPQATGPVDYMPGPPSSTPPTAEAPAAQEFVVDLSDEPRERRAGTGLRAAALLVGVLAAVVLEIGLLMHGGATSLWSRTPFWSAFASVAVVAGLAGVAARLAGNRPAARPVALAGLGGLALFWLLVVLPVADTDRGFVLTAALGCLIGAVLTAGRAERGHAR